MPDTRDAGRSGDEAAEVVGLLRSLPRTKITPETVTQHLIDRWYREKGNYLDEIRDLREQLADATGHHDRTTRTADRLRYHAERYRARAEEAEALPRITDGITAAEAEASATFDLTIDEVRALKADRDAATARTKKAEARLAELGDPETEQRVIGVSGLAYTPTELDLQHRSEWRPGVWLEERQVYPTPWREVPAATSADWTDVGDGWSSRRPDASLDRLRGPFTGLLGPLGIEADVPGAVPTTAEDPPEPVPCRGCGETYCDDSRETRP